MKWTDKGKGHEDAKMPCCMIIPLYRVHPIIIIPSSEVFSIACISSCFTMPLTGHRYLSLLAQISIPQDLDQPDHPPFLAHPLQPPSLVQMLPLLLTRHPLLGLSTVPPRVQDPWRTFPDVLHLGQVQDLGFVVLFLGSGSFGPGLGGDQVDGFSTRGDPGESVLQGCREGGVDQRRVLS